MFLLLVRTCGRSDTSVVYILGSSHLPELYEELAIGRESWGCDNWAAEDSLPDGIFISLYVTSISVGP